MKNSESKSEYSSYHSYMRTVCGSFQDIAHPDPLSKNLQQPNCTPPTNVVETDKFYLIEMAIPGYHKEELHVRVDEDVLSVDAKPLHRLDCIRLMHREEFGKTAFSCSLLLPENVQDNKISAEYDSGVLHIKIPKSRKPVLATKEIFITEANGHELIY